MKLIRNFSIVLLNFAFALASEAMPSWATLNTEGYNSSTGEATKYTAFLMSASSAASAFGGASVADIEGYYMDQATAGTFSIEVPKGAAAFSGPYFYDEQYTLDSYVGTGYTAADYIAVVFYDSVAFRVFGVGSADLVNGSLIFDDATASANTVGDWQDVPEPTSGLLMLLGLAGLALKRKNSK